MTEEEAKVILDCEYEHHGECSIFGEALQKASNALTKQVPKKIVYYKQFYGTLYRCPECEADQIPIDFFNSDGTEPSEKYSWCWKCGQKLDWGDAE